MDEQLDVTSPAEHASLDLPDEWDDRSWAVAGTLDSVLASGETGADAVAEHVGNLRHSHLSHLGLLGRPSIEWLTLWPRSLFIPAGADHRDYWPFPAPDDHRYALDWTSPGANAASRVDGTLSAFAQLVDPNGGSVRSEAGVGIRYRPSATLSQVDVQPQLSTSGTLRWLLQTQQLVAGAIRVRASVVLALWHEIPTGFDLLAHTVTTVADSAWRDQSHVPALQPFTRQYTPPQVSARFLVQGGRSYLIGVIARVTVQSTLTDNQGRRVSLSSEEFRAWGQMNATVSSIDVSTALVTIP